MTRRGLTRLSAAVAAAVSLGLMSSACSSPDASGPGAAGAASAPGSAPVTAPSAGGTPEASPGSADAAVATSTGTAVPGAGPAASASPSVAATPAELPGGGRTIFPAHRLVGFAGAPGSEALGRLGIGDLADKAAQIRRQAAPYAAGRTILPVYELIATLSHPVPGKDGQYRSRTSDAVIHRYLAAARKGGGLLLLNIQPGRADFLPEVKAYERWLREPDVGVALDPEWAVDPGQVPGRTYGNTSGRELDSVAGYLAGLVAEHDLPEKVMVFHQVARSVVRRESALRAHRGVVIVKSADGLGGPDLKRGAYKVLTRGMKPWVHAGFKLFYEEDRERGGRLLTPKEVLALRPRPEYVLYE